MMPLARYFLFVGGALMALLFAFDFFSPKAVAERSDPFDPLGAELSRIS
jgi:hypothetical protein